MRSRSWTLLQLTLLACGTALLGVSAAAYIYGSVSSSQALDAFDRAQEATSAGASKPEPSGAPVAVTTPADFTDWSAKRIREHKASLVVDKRLPLAVLGISRLRLRVPVFEGTDDLTLNRGAGWIVGTGKPGEAGNVGIAAHRDGFFRILKDVVVGDSIELETLGRRAVYVVDEIEIVAPEQVEVLQPRGAPSVTLVTCFPFYYVGDAPQRFIVHAALDSARQVR